MKTYFYTEIIEVDTLYSALESLEIDPKEFEELSQLIEERIHHTVLDVVLTQLEKENHQEFLTHVANENHQEALNHVREHIKQAEEHIKRAVHTLRDSLHKDIIMSRLSE